MGTLLYTEAEFDELSFHDCTLYGISWSQADRLVTLDIDFIAEWIAPAPGESHCRFRVGCASWTFRNVHPLVIEFSDDGLGVLEDQIDSVTRELSTRRGGASSWRYTVELTHSGQLVIDAPSFALEVGELSAPQTEQVSRSRSP
ncbi:MAG: hypothetical protein AAFR38_08795 [Planctomycetota bacterium]